MTRCAFQRELEPLRRARRSMRRMARLLERVRSEASFWERVERLAALPPCVAFHPFAAARVWPHVDASRANRTSTAAAADRPAAEAARFALELRKLAGSSGRQRAGARPPGLTPSDARSAAATLPVQSTSPVPAASAPPSPARARETAEHGPLLAALSRSSDLVRAIERHRAATRATNAPAAAEPSLAGASPRATATAASPAALSSAELPSRAGAPTPPEYPRGPAASRARREVAPAPMPAPGAPEGNVRSAGGRARAPSGIGALAAAVDALWARSSANPLPDRRGASGRSARATTTLEPSGSNAPRAGELGTPAATSAAAAATARIPAARAGSLLLPSLTGTVLASPLGRLVPERAPMSDAATLSSGAARRDLDGPDLVEPLHRLLLDQAHARGVDLT